MEVLVTKEASYTIISIAGELDASSTIILDEKIIKTINSDTKNIFIDFSNLEYIASAGVGVFLSHLEDIQEKEINLVLFGMNETVQGVFDILGLNAFLQIQESKEDALSTLV
ncbi:MAG: STAS domain-containing protein [Cytophagales bacterium]|nr:STAS domain-containing protein [Cytophagales bacterium]